MEKGSFLKHTKKSKNSSWNFPPELSWVGWSLWSVSFGLAPKHSKRSVKNIFKFELRFLALRHLTPCSSSTLIYILSSLAWHLSTWLPHHPNCLCKDLNGAHIPVSTQALHFLLLTSLLQPLKTSASSQFFKCSGEFSLGLPNLFYLPVTLTRTKMTYRKAVSWFGCITKKITEHRKVNKTWAYMNHSIKTQGISFFADQWGKTWVKVHLSLKKPIELEMFIFSYSALDIKSNVLV